MTTYSLPVFGRHLVGLALPLLISLATVSQAQVAPGQLPLLTKSGTGVPPNIMLTMDDSGSMAFQHMPEDVFASDTFTTANPVNSNTVRWDPNDNYNTNTNFVGTVPGNLATPNWVQKALRSPDTNTIFYNPEIRYDPWFTDNGVTRRLNSPPTTAYVSPPAFATSATSTTSMTVATGNKTFTLAQTGMLFSVGKTVVISSTATPTTQWMYGSITAFNSGTGAITVNVTTKTGSSTLASWNIVQSSYVNLTATVAVPVASPVSSSVLVAGQRYKIVVKGTSNWTNIGASNNNVDTTFYANGPTGGTGTARLLGWCYANDSNVSGTGTNYGNVSSNGCQAVTTAFTHDPGAYFRLQKTGSAYKAVNSAGNYTAYSINTSGSFTKHAARTDCVASSCSQAEERQNYANWFTYYRNRNLLARGAMMESFAAEGDTFRLGFGRINKGQATVDGADTKVIESSSTYGGGGVRAFNSGRKVNLFKWLEDLPASGGTPLVTAMNAIGTYYSRTSTSGPWTDNPGGSNTVSGNKTCRRSYQIIMTDGYWNDNPVFTGVGNADNTDGSTITGAGTSYKYVATRPYLDSTSNTLADVAMYYWKTDLQSATDNAVSPKGDNNSFWQNMTNFTVGLGVRGSLNPAIDLPALTSGGKNWPAAASGQTAANVDDLWHAAVNSRGAFFSAKDPKELSDSIKSALASANGGTGSTAGVATASTVLSNANRKYVPSFAAGPWSGDISANPLDASGQVSAAVWTAAARMPTWSNRNIVTWDTGLSTPAASLFKIGSMSASNQTALGSFTSPATTAKFIDFLYGDHSLEGVGNPFRTRQNANGGSFILGDFVNANPVLVQSSFDGQYHQLLLGGASGYANFLTAKAARTAVLFAGSNDGMLHGFKDTKAATPASALTDGQEVFAYVPRAVYGNLYKLADKNYGTSVQEHQFFVDGPLVESDAYIGGSWRNYLTGSLGAGGRAVYALDVTDLANLGVNTVKWEISSGTEPDLGYVLSPIRVGVLPGGQWVAVFGNGYSSTNGYATLFVVNLATAAVQKVNVETSGGNGLGGVTLIHDATGQISTIYAGDLKGNMWKFAATGNSVAVSGAAALFTATDSGGVAQPITSSPAVFAHSKGGRVVVFGTGKLFASADANDTSPQSIYGVWDRDSDSVGRPLTRSNLVARILSTVNGTGGASGSSFYSFTSSAVDPISNRGWYMDTSSSIAGGRVIYPTQVASFKTALVSSVAPVQGTPAVCDSGSGTGLNLILPVEPDYLASNGGSTSGGSTSPGEGSGSGGRAYDTNGDGMVTSADSVVVGYKTAADGIDAIVRSQTTNGVDAVGGAGGGGSQGDCVGICATGGGVAGQADGGAACVKNVAQCADPANPCLIVIAGATQNMKTCVPEVCSPVTNVTCCVNNLPVAWAGSTCEVLGGGGGNRVYDRVWRRIINPPIR
jgi:type IV pilus assembly protein PilY1